MKELMTMWWWYIWRLLIWNCWVKVNEMAVLRHQRDLKQDWNEKSNIVVPAVSWQILHHFLLLLRPLLSLFFTVVKWKVKDLLILPVCSAGALVLSAPAFSHLPNQQQRTQEKVYALPNRPHNTLTVWLMVMEFNLSLTLHLLTFLTWLVSILIG